MARENQIGEEKSLIDAAETSKEFVEWRGLQGKNLSILGLPKRKEWPQCHRESRGKDGLHSEERQLSKTRASLG